MYEREGYDEDLFSGASLPAFCDALRACSLQTLGISAPMACTNSSVTLLDALQGHATLQTLEITGYSWASQPEAARVRIGAALARVLTTCPALTRLCIYENGLGCDALRPLFAALEHNTSLRKLDVGFNDIGQAFARDCVLPAVRRHEALRLLEAREGPYIRPLDQAMKLVWERNNPGM